MMSCRFTSTIKRTASACAAAALFTCLLLGDPAVARPRPLSWQDTDAVAEPVAPAQRDQLFPSQRGGGISLAQATEMARGRVEGRVVSARPTQMGDRQVYEIRILGDDNRVHIVRIDAQTGQFL
jgi:hypothetical protein